jgi:hypothetical protein
MNNYFLVEVTTSLRKNMHWVKGFFQPDEFLEQNYPYATNRKNFPVNVTEITMQQYFSATGKY